MFVVADSTVFIAFAEVNECDVADTNRLATALQKDGIAKSNALISAAVDFNGSRLFAKVAVQFCKDRIPRECSAQKDRQRSDYRNPYQSSDDRTCFRFPWNSQGRNRSLSQFDFESPESPDFSYVNWRSYITFANAARFRRERRQSIQYGITPTLGVGRLEIMRGSRWGKCFHTLLEFWLRV